MSEVSEKIDSWDELIVMLIEWSKDMNSEISSVTYSKCGNKSGSYSGWDIRITVGRPGTLETDDDPR